MSAFFLEVEWGRRGSGIKGGVAIDAPRANAQGLDYIWMFGHPLGHRTRFEIISIAVGSYVVTDGGYGDFWGANEKEAKATTATTVAVMIVITQATTTHD